jgi:hypothetical protein
MGVWNPDIAVEAWDLMRFSDGLTELSMRLCPAGTHATSGGTTGPASIFETTSDVFNKWYDARLFNSSSSQRQSTLRAVCFKRNVYYEAGDSFSAGPQTQANGLTRCPSHRPHIVGNGFYTTATDGTMTIATLRPVDYNTGVLDGVQAWVDNSGDSQGGFGALPSCIAPL